ncbi:hypothetical protein TELCIR_08543 [Teladorsagia circumcincta]|uniref:Uncharacterized protein n=1 Tax=Teladorsagia circumcincta TaxID=45464 RepID=A0A2G9UHB7_TELCI|nr:hypothetical protein TELCIR_08543 [Teladorsagia circumcincta]
MGNRSTIEQRSAAGTDVTKNSKSSKPPSTVPSSSGAESTTGGSYTDNGFVVYFTQTITDWVDELLCHGTSYLHCMFELCKGSASPVPAASPCGLKRNI